MNTETIRRLADAVDAIRAAKDASNLGFVDGYCEQAVGLVYLAMKVAMDDDEHVLVKHEA